MRGLLVAAVLVLPAASLADTVVSTRVIRPGTVIGPTDIKAIAAETAGAIAMVQEVVGLEARKVLYPGRPIMPEDIGTPALVERNQIVILTFVQAGLQIMTEGKALSRGGEGDLIRVLNLGSKSTVTGQIQPDGSVRVGFSGS